ncbi:MAG: hypothetical protein IKB34_04010 [Clostridia bacterium]|nr:hypothetical protein [Clostridia bacterium]
MRKTVLGKLLPLLLILFSLLLSPMSAFANSAQMHWQGTDSTGTIVTGRECPITVKREKLIFDIPEFPDSYYSSAESLAEYGASVTAVYEFYNPADYTVTATLVFPFGGCPEYVSIYDEELKRYVLPDDTERYDVKINGEPTERILRHTLLRNSFDTEQEMKWLSDQRISVGLLTPDATVTVYEYAPEEGIVECYASCQFSGLGTLRNILMNANGYSLLEQGTAELGAWLRAGSDRESITVYCIGEPIDGGLDWKMYESGAKKKQVEGEMTLVSTRTLTLAELAMSKYAEGSTVSETDWYNAVIREMSENGKDGGYIGNEILLDPSGSFMRWYQYEITLEAGETLVNTVSAPIYPDIDGSFVPAKFSYTYLLSPAQRWAGFGSLDISIITPYHLLECSEPGWRKAVSGYAIGRDGLPFGELEFTLCESDSPEKLITPYTVLGDVLMGFIIAGLAIATLALIITPIIIIKHRRRR